MAKAGGKKIPGSDRPEYVPGYQWQPQRGQRVCKFIETICHHARGEWAGQPFILLPWQREFIETVYSWVDEHGHRRFRQAALFVSKKNGKSSLSACLALAGLLIDGEPMAEAVSCAADRAQASIVFREAAAIVRASPHLKGVLDVIDSRNTILHRKSMSRYYTLSGEHHRQEGINASMVIFDETHAQKDDRLWNAIRYATASRSNPLLLSISTAGAARTPGLPWWDLWQYCERVEAEPSLDPSFYGKIYAAPDVEDEEEYFTNREHWYNANPSLGHTISVESFESDAKEAQNTRTRRNAWLRYRLNRPVAIDGRFITPEAWNVGNREWSAPLEGRKCWCALDLASTRDLTCFLSLFPSEDGETYDVDCKFFIPKDCLQERVNRDHVPYDRWMADGFIESTPGNITDFEAVENYIKAYGEKHDIQQVAIDRWQGASTITRLVGNGLDCLGFGQGFASMSGATKLVESYIEAGKLNHKGNPVLSWNASNLIVEEDATGNVKPSKAKSSEKIDGLVCLIMAAAIQSTAEKQLEQSWEIFEI